MRVPFAVIDTETTGLDPNRDRIVSVAVVAIDDLTVRETPLLDTLVNPGVPIPERATHVHRIDDAAVASAPTFADVLVELAVIAERRVIVGHNVGFDLAIIGREARRVKTAWRTPEAVCTARLVARLAPPLTQLDLADQLRRLGVTPRGVRHTAHGDALLAADLLIALAHRLIGSGRGTLGDAVATG